MMRPLSITCSISKLNEVFCKRARIFEYLWRDKIRTVGACASKIGCPINSLKSNSSGYTKSGIFRLVQHSAKKYTMSYSKKRPLAVAPLPLEDEALIVDGKSEDAVREHFQQEEGMFLAYEDEYDGVIVDPNNLPFDGDDFVSSLKASLSRWRQQEGFWYHHAEPTYVMLAYWIPENSCTLPPNASHQVGVGGFVFNNKNEVLVVQEKDGPFRGTGVWKIPTGVIHQGEDIFSGAIREIKEEMG